MLRALFEVNRPETPSRFTSKSRLRATAGYCVLPGVASLMTAMLESACKRRSVLARLSSICTRRRAREDHEGVLEMSPAAAYV
jgi:hypothetical protein